ncbi:MAG TPA: hypothetical protein DCM67_08480 [Propionibacteriaceae bacterium]|nr:hypothetical protein [Propionibacteriaceae bacterium]
MSILWTPSGSYRRVEYASESDLESAIVEVQHDLFGANRFYLDVKKKIGAKGGIRNVPDGYLIDLSGREPRLYVVENELAAHDPLRHIAVQILQFSLSFESEPHTVKKVLFDTLNAEDEVKKRCEAYAPRNGYRNLDHLLEHLVWESPFGALVIIDELPENLETVLAKRFQFGVEVLELARFENKNGDRAYHFAPFLADLTDDLGDEGGASPKLSPVSAADVDTVVVPAREEGFQETFIGENCWYAVRLHATMRGQIRYIAAYRVAPVQAITHIAPVKSVEPWKDTGKWCLHFSERAKEIAPVGLIKGGRVKAPQSLRYTTRERLMAAKSLDDIW